MKKVVGSTVDMYIHAFSPEIAARLEKVRRIIRETLPESRDGISYHMPAYQLLGKPLSYFATHAAHLGFCTTLSSHEAFAEDPSAYISDRGSTVTLKQPLPLDLIRRMVTEWPALITK